MFLRQLGSRKMAGLSESESAECGIAILKWMRRANTLTHVSLHLAKISHGRNSKKQLQAVHFFFQLDGAGADMFLKRPKNIVLRRADFIRLHDYASNHAPLRDYCLIRIPMKCGLRPGEIRNLQWRQIDFDNLTIKVMDSKKHRLRLVPMDPLTAEYLKQLEYEQKEGVWVIQRDTQRGLSAWRDLEKPLSYDALDKIVKKWGRAAGCQTWKQMNLYMLRHFFAAHWIYVKKGSIHTLSRILGHESVATTQIYLNRLVFYEDLQSEYRRLQSGPILESANSNLPPKVGNWFFDKFCRTCMHQATCRFIDEAMSSQWASGCRYYKKIKEVHTQVE